MAIVTAKDLVAEAAKHVETISAEEAVKLIGKPDVVFVDLRESEELQKGGRLMGAIHVPRGLLEFQIDTTNPMHKTELGSGRKVVLFCGSGSRSALAGKSLKDMGVESVAHVAGGFPALRKAGAVTQS